MRTTLTIDDIAAVLKRLCDKRGASFKETVNQTLRQGLQEMMAPVKPRKTYRTSSVDLGEPLLPNIDNVAEVLAAKEGDIFR